jgi:hypothetical protein
MPRVRLGLIEQVARQQPDDLLLLRPQPILSRMLTQIQDPLIVQATLPAPATYEVFVWYPARSDYNSATPGVIATPGGNTTVRVNQQLNGGRWVSLGSFTLNAGSYNVVGVSRWSGSAGYIIADAVKLIRR